MIKVHIHEQHVSDALDVFIINEQDGLRRLLHMESAFDFRWDEIGQPEAALSDVVLEPTFTLPMGSGPLLLEALVRHYHGAEDTRQLRKDYEAERKRVDLLANSLIDIARASAERGFRS